MEKDREVIKSVLASYDKDCQHEWQLKRFGWIFKYEMFICLKCAGYKKII